MYESAYRTRVLNDDPPAREGRLRLVVFLVVFAIVAGVGLAYDYSRTAIYRATARIAVDPPGVDDATAKAQFAVTEALALQKSDILAATATSLGMPVSELSTATAEQRLMAEAIAQTNVIELRADGPDRTRLVTLLVGWIEAYQVSRRQTDRAGESEAASEARHAVTVAEKSVAAKRQEIEAYRQRYGIASTEREENPAAARLKGLHAALNDAAAKEVAAEAKLKSIDDSLAAGKGYVRAGDRGTIANLEMRAVEQRERMKDLEHDFTAQYLALDPKYKSLKANLQRLEQQIEKEKQRSQSTARVEAQEEYAGAQRATLKIREQVDALQKDTQSFSTRFLELRRMTTDLDLLQESRREAVARLQRIETALKPAAVRIQVLTAPAASSEPIDPPYARDAAIALGAALVVAIGVVGLGDYLLRQPKSQESPAQPIIQIAYPSLGNAGEIEVNQRSLAAPAAPMLSAPVVTRVTELSVEDIRALWATADVQGRRLVALLFTGIAPSELGAIRGRDLDLEHGFVEVPGSSARRISFPEALHSEIALLLTGPSNDPARPIVADGASQPLSDAEIDTQLACCAHDAGLRHAETVTASALHFTYAAFLARQGIRMSALHTIVGRLSSTSTNELLRLSPPGGLVEVDAIDRTYPAFRHV